MSEFLFFILGDAYSLRHAIAGRREQAPAIRYTPRSPFRRLPLRSAHSREPLWGAASISIAAVEYH